MSITATILIYLLIGLEVAEVVFLADDRRESVELAFRTVTAVVFWPLYVPLLLRTDEQPPVGSRSSDGEYNEPASNMQVQPESVSDDSGPASPVSRAG